MMSEVSPNGASVTLRERVARAIAEASDDGVFDRDEPECTSDQEDRDWYLTLADAALEAHAAADWQGQVSAREAVRSELIRQHLAGECGTPQKAEEVGRG